MEQVKGGQWLATGGAACSQDTRHRRLLGQTKMAGD